jgi:hypothetical protein
MLLLTLRLPYGFLTSTHAVKKGKIRLNNFLFCVCLFSSGGLFKDWLGGRSMSFRAFIHPPCHWPRHPWERPLCLSVSQGDHEKEDRDGVGWNKRGGVDD